MGGIKSSIEREYTAIEWEKLNNFLEEAEVYNFDYPRKAMIKIEAFRDELYSQMAEYDEQLLKNS